MKKKILTLAIAAIASLGFMASAQQQAPQNKMYTPQTFTDYAFEGVLLDLPQQTRIDSLHAAIRTPQMNKVHAISVNPDSARTVAQRAPIGHGRIIKGGRGTGKPLGVMPGVEYVAKVKEILTPEQFDMFMANIQAMPDNVVNNLMPAPKANCDKQAGNCDNAAQCKSDNCDNAAQCTSDNCDKQNCNATSQNCTKSDNCTSANCKDGNHHKGAKPAKATKAKKVKK